MNMYRVGCVAGTMLSIVAMVPAAALAQTPQEQDAARRLQQNDPNEERLRMNDAARRMQQNDPYAQPGVQGQGSMRGYPGNAASMAARPKLDATAATAGAEWVPANINQQAPAAVYAARSTIRRSGNLVTMWDMHDFKAQQAFQGKQYLSLKNQMEYDCKGARSRLLSTTAYSGHSGKGGVVVSDVPVSPAWQAFAGGSPAEALSKIACALK